MDLSYIVDGLVPKGKTPETINSTRKEEILSPLEPSPCTFPKLHSPPESPVWEHTHTLCNKASKLPSLVAELDDGKLPSPRESKEDICLHSSAAQPRAAKNPIKPLRVAQSKTIPQVVGKTGHVNSQELNEHILILDPHCSQMNQYRMKTRQFACQDCGRSFFRKSDLVRHIQIHLGIKPNVCNVCGKQFIQKSALTVHLRVHTGEKPYSCHICRRAFSDSSSLARHRRIHFRQPGP